ncbi:MAG: amidohydrolase family protein [Verrucomicrobia bacterium]|nr:amidohydrolase family protein [Verrucomicrobiota bacterium]MDA1066948.1 amidohydrolase family protein [Verrucomicrobiota bacterium]
MRDAQSSSIIRALRGTWLNPISDDQCDFFSDGILLAEKKENSWVIIELGDTDELVKKYGLGEHQIEKQAGLLMPPFFDMHFHWVQDDVREMPKTSLLEWLNRYTFPREAEFADYAIAEEKAKIFWKRILATGTIGGLCYSSIHQVALEAAMRNAPEHFKIGNVLMTMNSPPNLTQSDEEAIQLTQWAASTFGQRHVASPRFAPTTGPEVITASAEAAASIEGYSQTHMCETHEEIEWVKSIYRELHGFEDIDYYIQVYERTGFLGPKTVLGHCIHLTDAEWKLMGTTDTVIASCPTSNGPLEERGLGSGLFDFQRADAERVRWVLATDIGGGPYLSMLDVMASFVRQNRASGVNSATFVKALFRSTQAGADVLGLGHRKGSFKSGKDLDFIAVKVPTDQILGTSAEVALESAIMPFEGSREKYESLILKTVIEGDTVFEC